MTINPGTDILGVFAFQEMRDAGSELDDLEPTLDGPDGVLQSFTVFLGDDCREVFFALLQEVSKPHQNPGASNRGGGSPSWKRPVGAGHCAVDVTSTGKRHGADRRAGGRVCHLALSRAG